MRTGKINTTVAAIVAITAFVVSGFIIAVLVLPQGSWEILTSSDRTVEGADGDYVMMFAFQYGAGAYFLKIDSDLTLWASPGMTEGCVVTVKDFSNPQLNWRSTQITQEDFNQLVSLAERTGGSFCDDFVVFGAWTLTAFYGSNTFRRVTSVDSLGPLEEKIVELSPMRIDLTVRGGS